MDGIAFPIILLLWLFGQTCTGYENVASEAGSFAFKEAGNRRPPMVKKPPYTQSRMLCPGMNAKYYIPEKYQSLCGDLNQGFIPANPMGQSPLGEQYPFFVIKKKALKFFAKTIPTLKNDEHMPKIAMFEESPLLTRERGGADYFGHHGESRAARTRRNSQDKKKNDNSKKEDDLSSDTMNIDDGVSSKEASEVHKSDSMVQSSGTDTGTTNDRSPDNSQAKAVLNLTQFKNEKINVTKDQARDFLSAMCDGQDNIICTLMSFIMKPQKSTDKTDVSNEEDYYQHVDIGYKQQPVGPGTPCPSYNEYVTPTYARNHHGSWRYVVQIPYEGYFTQTVQVTRCRDTNCAYIEGRCKSSPRWISLLVAEIYYPELYYSSQTTKTPSVRHPPAPEYVSTSSKYTSYRPNEKVNVGPFIRPVYNKPSDLTGNPDLPHFGKYYPTATNQYYQSLSGIDGSQDSFLRTNDDVTIPISTDEFYRHQQYLHKVASSQGKRKKSAEKSKNDRIMIRTKRQDSVYKTNPSPRHSGVINHNVTTSDFSKSNQHCDGYDNLGCFVVRMYYDWFVVSGECKCWMGDFRHFTGH